MIETRSPEEPIETPENKDLQSLGSIDQLLPEGWYFKPSAPYGSLINPEGKEISLLYGAVYGEEAGQVGLPGLHERPGMGEVMRTANGKLYVCISPATPNDPPNPNEFQWAPRYPNKYEATWAPVPDEIASQI